jgi:hypothetical protein
MTNHNIGHIENLGELKLAMAQLKQRITEQEKALSARAEKIPEEALKSAVAGFLPGIISGALLTQGWRFIKLIPTIYTLFSALRKKS